MQDQARRQPGECLPDSSVWMTVCNYGWLVGWLDAIPGLFLNTIFGSDTPPAIHF